MWEAHPRAEQLRNQVAVCRGPVVYCLESADLPPDCAVANVCLPSDATFVPVPAEGLPFGMTALEGRAVYRRQPGWAEELYRPLGSAALEPLRIKLIPYFAWANRGASAVTVWMPLVLGSVGSG